MSSYLDNIKNYSHCPLKKRPLCIVDQEIYNESYDQPQDLRIKRRKENDDDSNDTSAVTVSSPPKETIIETSPDTVDLASPYSPYPSLSPGHPRIPVILPSYEMSSKSLPESRVPPLADFYIQLFQSTAYQKQQQQLNPWETVWQGFPNNTWNSVPSAESRVVPAPSISPVDSHLSSPRSTSSEDSGVCSEVVSEDEIDVTACSDSNLAGRHCCTSCGKSYSTQSGLRKHLEIHCSSLTSRTFECKHCSKSYTSVGALKMHIRTHTLPCKCNVCGKAFSRPWLLQGHIRTHTGEKPFECHQCHRSFADRSNLRAHQQTHERVKKYACQNCNKTFSRMSLLSKHSENSCPHSV